MKLMTINEANYVENKYLHLTNLQNKLGKVKAVVKTSITSRGDTFPLDYKLTNASGKWRVYDVVIENIGLVANYRNEFAGIIRKDKLSGLIQRLKDKEKK